MATWSGFLGFLWLILSAFFLYQAVTGAQYVPSWDIIYLVSGETDPVNLVLAALFIPAFGILLAYAALNLLHAGATNGSPLTDLVRGFAEYAAPLGVVTWISFFSFVFMWGGGAEDIESQAPLFSNWFLFWFFLLAAPAYTQPKKTQDPLRHAPVYEEPKSTLTWFASVMGRQSYRGYLGTRGKTVYAEDRKDRGKVLAAGVIISLAMVSLAIILAYAASASPVAAGQEKYERTLRTMVFIISGFCITGAAYAFILLVGASFAATAIVFEECAFFPLPHVNGYTVFTSLLPAASIIIGKDDILSTTLTDQNTVFTLRLKDGNILLLRWGIDPSQAPAVLDAINKIRAEKTT